MGLSLDLGYLGFERRRMQTAADAGARSGGAELKRNQSSRIVSSARAATATHGFTHGAGNVTVAVNHPPSSGRYVGDSGFVEVIVTQPRPTYFMGLFRFSNVTVRSRAAAGLAGSTNCIYALNATKSKSIEIGSGSAIAASCGVIVNSQDSQALHVSSGSCLTATSVAVTGNYYQDSCGISPTPVTAVPPEPDPMAYLQPPSTAGLSCDYTNFKISSQVRTLSPGVYCGGIKIESGSTATLTAGEYILMGGGLEVTSLSTITGSGVTFYNTFGGSWGYKPILIASGSQARLSAPLTGPRAGVLFFQDRSAPPGEANKIESNTNSWFEGALYFPTQHLMFHSNTVALGSARYTVIVADTLAVTSGTATTIPADYSTLSGGSPAKRLAMVE